jgi:hypothetical protein
VERAVFYLIRNVELWRLDPLVPLDQTLDRFEHMKAVGVDRSRCDDDAMLCPSAPGSSISG